MRSSIRLRIPLRNSMRELRKWSLVASDHIFSNSGMAVSQTKHPRAFLVSSISGLLHLHRQYLIFQLCAAGGKGRHRGGKADVPAQRPDLDHEFVAFLEQ